MRRKKLAGFVCIMCAAVLAFGVLGFRYILGQPGDPVMTVNDDDKALLEEADEKGSLKLAVKAAVLVDAETGKVIYKQNAHKELPPASVTKVMTMLLTMEAVEAGKVKLSDQVTISERAASMGGSQMYMEVGETHTLEELLEGIAIVSANDACVAVSEYIAGSEEVFVEKMNARAGELGMRDTHFVNTNGLPVADHYTSAYDIALMSQRLLKFDHTREWFQTWQKTIKVGLPGKEKEFGLTNTNKLIRQYPGANGIKTGFTAEAGYCLSASATKDETTLIAVVLGAETSKTRNAEVAKLLNYGFANYKSVTLAEKNQKMKKVRLAKGDPEFVNAITTSRITAFIAKSENVAALASATAGAADGADAGDAGAADDADTAGNSSTADAGAADDADTAGNSSTADAGADAAADKVPTGEAKCKVTIDDGIKLPLKKGTKIGTATVYVGKEKVGEYDLVSDRNAGKASFFTYCGRVIKGIFNR